MTLTLWCLGPVVGCCASVALLFASHCSANGGEDRTVTVTVKQSDLKDSPQMTTKATKGDKLEVKLETKATGYAWTLSKSNEDRLKATGKPFTEKGESKPGASSYKVFTFEVSDGGELEFQLARPFGNPDARVLKLKIELQK